ncbi:MAG: hypothetical protein ABIE14_01465, partial [Patescibacteria group bacterium]
MTFGSLSLFACTQPVLKLAEPENLAINETEENERLTVEEISNDTIKVWLNLGKVREMLQEKNPQFDYALHEVDIKEVSENHAFGGVRLPNGPGNLWLAAKIDNEWQIVWMGLDVPDCD